LNALPVTVAEQNITYDISFTPEQSGLHLLLVEPEEVQIWGNPGKEL